jgi:SSS family solute:Na+ symporter
MSVTELKGRDNPKGLEVDSSMFRTSPGFTVGALIVTGVIVALYTILW